MTASARPLPRRVVVVGASVAGIKTAQALRANGYEGSITLVGDEAELPYDRPPLSKGFLAGSTSVDDVMLTSAAEAAADGIELLLGRRAVALDTGSATVALEGGEQLGYDSLVIATGARARPSPWGRTRGVHLLRTLADSRALHESMRVAEHLAIVGGGFVGCEVAATARQMGLAVTLLDDGSRPLARVAGPRFGELVRRLHEDNGVAMRFGVTVRGIDRGDAGDTDGDRLVVGIDGGDALRADVALVAIGSVPNDEWLASSALHVADGVVCDAYGRAEGAEAVWAVGDVARWRPVAGGPSRRNEHWTAAVEQANLVARNIARPDELRPLNSVEHVWSDQHGVQVQVVGRSVEGAEERLYEREGSERSVMAVQVDSRGIVTSAASLDWPRAIVECRRAIGAGLHVAEVEQRVPGLVAEPSRATAAAGRAG